MPESSATLGLVVDSSGALVATESLRKLTQTGAQAERQTETLASVSRRLSETQTQVSRATTETAQKTQALTAATERQVAASRQWAAMSAEARERQLSLNAAVQASSTAMTSAGAGVKSFREPLTSLVTQMAGADPVAGRLVSIFGSFALGSTTMVGALAGLAALSAGYRILTADIRAASDAAQEHKDRIDALRERQQSEALGRVGGGIADLSFENQIQKDARAAQADAQRRINDDQSPQQVALATRDLKKATDELAASQARAVTIQHEITAGRREDTEAAKNQAEEQRRAGTAAAEAARTMRDALAELRYEQEQLAASMSKLLADTVTAMGVQAPAARAVPGSTGGANLNATMSGVDDITRRQDAVAKAATTQARFNTLLEQQSRSLATARQRLEEETAAAKEAVKAQQDLAAARAASNKQIAIQAALQIGGMVSSHLTSSGHRTAGAAVGVATSTAAGFASGGPIGAAAGFVVGLTGALLDHNRAAKEAAKAEKELTEQRRLQANETLAGIFYGNQSNETRKAFADAEVLRNQGREKEAAAAEREAKRKAMEDRFQRELVDETKAGGFNLASLLAAQAAERLAFETTKAADAMRGLTGDLNGPQGLRKSLYLWRTQGDQSLWGPPGNPGNDGLPRRGGGGVGTETATVVNNYITIDGLSVPIGSNQTPGQVLDMVVAERNRRARNGSPDPLALAVVR